MGGQASPIHTAYTGPGRPRVLLHAYVLGPGLPGPRSREAGPPWTRAQIGPHNGKGSGAFYGPGADPWPNQATWAGVGSLRSPRTPDMHTYWDGSLLPAPVPGLERPGTRRTL